MKLLKKIIYILIALVILLFIGISVFIATFDANQYKAQISEQVEAATGRKLTIEGDISLSVFPWLGLQINKVALANAAGFGDSPMAQIDQLDVRVEILPLLKSQISIDTVVLNGMVVRLHQKEDGSNNWQDLAQAGSKQKPQQSAPAAQPAESSAPALGALFINGVEVRDAQLQFTDDVAGQSIKLDKLNLVTGAVAFDKRIPLSFDVHVALAQPKADVNLSLKTGITLDAAFSHVKLDTLKLNIDSRTPELPATQAHVELAAQVNALLKQQQFTINQLVMDVSAQGDGLPGGAIAASLSSNANIDLKSQQAQLKPLQLKVLGVSVDAEANAQQIMSDPQLTGTVRVNEFNPSLLPSQLGIELPPMADPKALQKLSLSLNIDASTKAADITQFNLTLDDTHLSGDLHASEFDRPALAFNLALDSIDADRYLPPPAEEETPVAAAPVVVEKDIPIELPLEPLRKLKLDGVFTAGKIRIAKQDITSLSITTTAADGILRVNPLSLNVLDGSVTASARLDARGNVPVYAADFKASGLKTGEIANPMLAKLKTEKPIKVDGAANVAANVSTKGASVNALVAALNGKLNFNVLGASLKDVDLEYMGRKIVVDYVKEKKYDKVVPIPADWPGKYKPGVVNTFRTMRASAVINNGVVTNKDLLMDSPRLKITGAGKINLVQKSINYRTVVDLNTGGTSTEEQLMNLPFAIRTKGPFSQLDISLDLKDWSKAAGKLVTQKLKAKAKKEVNKVVDKEKAEAKKKVDEKLEKEKQKLKEKLKNLF